MRRNPSTLKRTALPLFLLASLVPSPAIAMQPFIDPDSVPPRALERSTPLMSSECGSELRIGDPIVDIQELPDPVYVHTLSKSEISAIEKESSGRMREAAGLTLVLAGTVQTYTSPAQTLSGTDCVVFHGVRIVPMKQVTVYVAREYPVGSCNYREVKRHEEKHVAIARRLVGKYRSRIERVVGDLRLQSRGFPAREDQNASTGKVTSDVVTAVQGVIDELQVAMVNANRVLDKADTDKTLQACPFW